MLTLFQNADRWLNPEKSLPEQRITENDMVILRKKFFYSDINIDRNDPVQLNLLYVQSKDAIVNGKYPCTPEEAAQFAGIQLQVQFGSHEPDKHKPGFTVVSDFLPPDYRKDKSVEKLMYNEHRKLQGMTEWNAKYRYIQLCRSLKTYGVSFFLVKEMNPKKKKLVDVLLGITKDNVVRLDVDTKEVIKSWPLSQLRRWAASPNTFTLDFGDYADAYYSIQTSDGEQISQIIAGYIDIILKKKREAERVVAVEESKQEKAIVEDFVKPGRVARAGGINTHQASGKGQGARQQVASPNSYYGATKGRGILSMGSKVAELSVPQQITLQNIQNGHAGINHAIMEMNAPSPLPPMGNDASALRWKQNTVDVNIETIAVQMHTHLAAVASIINQTVTSKINYETTGINIATINANISQLSGEVKLLSALQSDEAKQEAALGEARKVAITTSRFLVSLQQFLLGNDDPNAYRGELFASAGDVSNAVKDLLQLLNRLDVTPDHQQKLLAVAQQLSESIQQLSQRARITAGYFRDQQQQQSIMNDAKEVELQSEHVFVATEVLAPAVTSQVCMDQLLEATVLLKDSVQALTEMTGSCPNDAAYGALRECASTTGELIAKLIKVAQGADGQGESHDFRQHAEIIVNYTNDLIKNDNVEALLAGTRGLTLTATQLANNMKIVSEGLDNDSEALLLAQTAMNIANATQRMVAFARDLSRTPQDNERKQKLVASMDNLVKVVDVVRTTKSSNNDKFKKLNKSLKNTLESSTQLLAASRSAAPYNRNLTSQSQLNKASRAATDTVAELIAASKAYKDNENDPKNQLRLLKASKAALSPLSSFIASAKAAAPTISESSIQSQLLNTATTTLEHVQYLETLANEVEKECPELSLQVATLSLDNLIIDLSEAREHYKTLRPNGQKTAEMTVTEIENLVQNSARVLQQLQAGVAQRNVKIAAMAANDAVIVLATLGEAAKHLSALTDNDVLRTKILDVTIDAVSCFVPTIANASNALVDSKQAEALNRDISATATALSRVVNCLPGHQNIEGIVARVIQSVQSIKPSASGSDTYQSAKSKFMSSASALAASSTALVSATRGSPLELQAAVSSFESNYFKVMETAQAVLATSRDPTANTELMRLLSTISEASARLLDSTQSASASSSDPTLRAKLVSSVQTLNNSINRLLEAVEKDNKPGQNECNTALERIANAASSLDAINEGYVPLVPYFDASNQLFEGCKNLNAAIFDIVSLLRSGDVSKAKERVMSSSKVLENVVKSSSAAAYAIGLSDPNSVPRQPGLLNDAAIIAAIHELQEECRHLQAPVFTVDDVTHFLNESLVKNIQVILNEAKSATTNPKVTEQNRRQISSAIKNLVQQVQGLGAAGKVFLDNTGDLDAQKELMDQSKQFFEQLDEIEHLCRDQTLRGTAPYITPQGQAQQKPIIDAAKSLTSCSADLFTSIKLACADVNDKEAATMLSTNSRFVSEAIKKLTNAALNAAPGQKECSQTISKLDDLLTEVDNAILAFSLGNLEPSQKDSKWYLDVLREQISVLANAIGTVSHAATSDPNLFATSVTELSDSAASVLSYGIGLAASSPEDKIDAQELILECTKNVGTALLTFLSECKHCGGNQANEEKVKAVLATNTNCQMRIDELTTAIAQLDNIEDEIFGQIISDIQKRIAGLDDLSNFNAKNNPYQYFGLEVEKTGKSFVDLLGTIVAKTKTPEAYDELVLQIADSYVAILDASMGTIVTSNELTLKVQIRESLELFSAYVITLLESMRSMQRSSDASSRLKLSGSIKEVSSGISRLMKTTKEGLRALKALEEAYILIVDIVNDLEALTVFAKAGQLDPTDSRDYFSRYSGTILSEGQKLTEFAKSLMGLVKNGIEEEKLAGNAKIATGFLMSIKDSIKRGATAITSADKFMQVELLQITKGVAITLDQLIKSAHTATITPKTAVTFNAAQLSFSGSVEKQILALNELIKTVKLLSDEHQRGLRAIDGTVASIGDQLDKYLSTEPAVGTALPDEVVELAKQVGRACINLVTTAQSAKNDDIVGSVSSLLHVFEELSRSGKAMTENAPEDQRQTIYQAVQNVGNSTQQLLVRIRESLATDSINIKNILQKETQIVSVAVENMVATVGQIVPSGYVDSNDPNVVAERELLKAAAFIEAASVRLSQLQVERSEKTGEPTTFDGQIFEAAKAIAAATAALIKSATAAQREIISKNKNVQSPATAYFSDGTWSEGLVSSAKMVATQVGDLCDSANLTVRAAKEGGIKDNNEARERIVVSAKAVSASTTQLLMAATTQTERYSESLLRLKAAGKSVVQATDHLVKAAAESMAFDSSDVVTGQLLTGGTASVMAAEMQAQVDILRIERELENARKKLGDVRKHKYQVGTNNSAQSPAPRSASTIVASNHASTIIAPPSPMSVPADSRHASTIVAPSPVSAAVPSRYASTIVASSPASAVFSAKSQISRVDSPSDYQQSPSPVSVTSSPSSVTERRIEAVNNGVSITNRPVTTIVKKVVAASPNTPTRSPLTAPDHAQAVTSTSVSSAPAQPSAPGPVVNQRRPSLVIREYGLPSSSGPQPPVPKITRSTSQNVIQSSASLTSVISQQDLKQLAQTEPAPPAAPEKDAASAPIPPPRPAKPSQKAVETLQPPQQATISSSTSQDSISSLTQGNPPVARRKPPPPPPTTDAQPQPQPQQANTNNDVIQRELDRLTRTLSKASITSNITSSQSVENVARMQATSAYVTSSTRTEIVSTVTSGIKTSVSAQKLDSNTDLKKSNNSLKSNSSLADRFLENAKMQQQQLQQQRNDQ